jgi:putative salt-induced outer membrane protein YdiY
VYGGDLSMHIFPLFSGRLLFSLGYGYRSFLLKDVPDSTKKKQNFTFSQNYFVTRVQWLIGNSFFLKVDGETDRLFNFDNKTAFTAGLGFFIR